MKTFFILSALLSGTPAIAAEENPALAEKVAYCNSLHRLPSTRAFCAKAAENEAMNLEKIKACSENLGGVFRVCLDMSAGKEVTAEKILHCNHKAFGYMEFRDCLYSAALVPEQPKEEPGQE